MRARYTAYALGDEGYLMRTWHAAHRPARIGLDPRIVWTGLRVGACTAGGPDDDTGTVEFAATWRDVDGTTHILRECSAFARRARRWVYVGPTPTPIGSAKPI